MKLSRRSETKQVAPLPDAPPPPPPARVDGNGHGAAAAHVPVAVAVAATRAPGTRAPMIGELLIQDGAASADQVKNALRQQRKDRRPLGELLVQLGVPSARVTVAVGWQLGLAPVDLDDIYIQPEAIDTLTALFARAREVVPYGINDEGRLHVASTKPGDPALAKEVAEAPQRDVQMELADVAGIRRQLDVHYAEERIRGDDESEDDVLVALANLGPESPK